MADELLLACRGHAHAMHVCRIQREAMLMASLGGRRTRVGQGGRDLWIQVGCHGQLSAKYQLGCMCEPMCRLQAYRVSGTWGMRSLHLRTAVLEQPSALPCHHPHCHPGGPM